MADDVAALPRLDPEAVGAIAKAVELIAGAYPRLTDEQRRQVLGDAALGEDAQPVETLVAEVGELVGARLAQHRVLRRGQALAPVGIAVHDLELSRRARFGGGRGGASGKM